MAIDRNVYLATYYKERLATSTLKYSTMSTYHSFGRR
jgi:hypothetical protein